VSSRDQKGIPASVIVNLISGPRNVSTALMYSFAQRSDTEVLDEPFYAVYLTKTGARHPGSAEVLQSMPIEEAIVRKHIGSRNVKPVLFLKNMAHHLEALDDPNIDDAINIFLIRDPAQILASYSQVIAQPVMRDIGIAYQYSLFRQMHRQGIHPIVVDSGLLLQVPLAVLMKMCRHCGLSFEQRMAHWPAGPKPFDGVWAPHWYANVHRSTGFEKPAAESPVLPTHLLALHREAKAFYENLLPFALKA
jgi:hypothetical protein